MLQATVAIRFAIVRLATDPAKEAGVREQAPFKPPLVQPMLTAGDAARKLLAWKVPIGGMHGVH